MVPEIGKFSACMCVYRVRIRTLGWVRWIVRCFSIRRQEHKLVSTVDCQTSDEGVNGRAQSAVLQCNLHGPSRRNNVALDSLRLTGLDTLLLAVVQVELEVFHCAWMREETKKLGSGSKGITRVGF